jgi:hypothetical protein
MLTRFGHLTAWSLGSQLPTGIAHGVTLLADVPSVVVYCLVATQIRAHSGLGAVTSIA